MSQLADQLDPAECQPARAWLDDEEAQASAMAALAAGESYAVSVRDDQAVYVFTAQVGTGAEPVLPGRESAWPI
ncbi:hypothetical protein [Kitasatospora sp. MBT63]|uniref:hypothetical protein n=1 Tax=Kitasatospora sp. MBT63 TaxID=1444768 RepID=UPI00068B9A81|nr:hypothetical protein [Kitasatospora sp. MBT63]